MRKKVIFQVILVLLFSGCVQTQPLISPSATFVELSPTPTTAPSATPTSIPPTATPEPIDKICSPLQNILLEEIPSILTQPFSMPRLRNDDGHQGIDLAFFRFKDIVGIEGLQINAVMSGKIAFILPDHYPYGNVVVQEIPLEKLSPRIQEILAIPNPIPTVQPDPRMASCPIEGELPFSINLESRSLYILYGHLKTAPIVLPGDLVSCGQPLGEVGNTGKSTNPHLHLELRVGPSGARFDSMAFYTTSSTSQERYNYCVWRVSQLFQLIDPTKLLSIQP